jgi:hypothetical protein
VAAAACARDGGGGGGGGVRETARGRLGMGACASGCGTTQTGGGVVGCAVTPLRPAGRKAVRLARPLGPILRGGDAI